MATYEFIKGDIVQSSAAVLVVPVALQCATGTDLANRIKIQKPSNAESYGNAIAEGKIELGTLWYYSPNKSRKGYVNMPVKNHWRSKIDLDMIRVGIGKLANWIKEESVAFSQEELDTDVDWNTVKEIIVEAFDSKEIKVEIWEKQ